MISAARGLEQIVNALYSSLLYGRTFVHSHFNSILPPIQEGKSKIMEARGVDFQFLITTLLMM
jgi:hypothetical protein